MLNVGYFALLRFVSEMMADEVIRTLAGCAEKGQ